jgi:predicted phage-related endonuclease
MDTLLSENVPAKYVTQMQWQMACTGRKWCDFASYDPRLPEKMQLFVKRVPRDDAYIELLEKEVSAFIVEMTDKLEKLKEKYYGI